MKTQTQSRMVARWAASLAVSLAAVGLLLAAGGLISPARAGWPVSAHGGHAQPLAVGEAFRVLPLERQGPDLVVGFDIAPGYFLYQQRLAFWWLEADAAATEVHPSLPAAEPHDDPELGPAPIYRGILSLHLPLPASGGASGRLRLRYQGCSDLGICYPPQTVEIALPSTSH